MDLISGPRSGSIAATGNRSYHGQISSTGEVGRAVDIPPLMAYFDSIKRNHAAHTKELIFSLAPLGARREIRNGAAHACSRITRAMYYDHVHWAMTRGGMLDAFAPVMGALRGDHLPPR